ncbi:uncharacterized protein Z518_00881 [Rhinocladiella mackenziei CBS 650.93]|uniref:Major facilitator superfamily (MFS) profile domain-containing protein n=1 Tax=Rhinocladiella mackenziei CBS 650.93 TaxID=1442369 RepID=A0A0D2JJZ7_9EURO|nr:uncharacterized protein Z518_00881 [Rhinocladiella mackenziei CBS 650.93]KIX09800.1 hypothetical protein Z518_00881 [Rhinocladiella mackenziei CBS 650.93]
MDGSLDLQGKRVAVIGTGASGVQLVQAISKVASNLTVFQRTPNMALPMGQSDMNNADNQRVKENFQDAKQKIDSTYAGFLYDFVPSMGRDANEEERNETWEQLFYRGGLHFWLGNYLDLLEDPDVNAAAYRFWRKKALARITNPETAKILAPEIPPHPFGSKRVSLEQGYFECFNRFRTKDGVEHKFDVVIFATGFDAITGSMTKINIRGKDGSIREKWANGVYTYLGMTTHGFPTSSLSMTRKRRQISRQAPHIGCVFVLAVENALIAHYGGPENTNKVGSGFALLLIFLFATFYGCGLDVSSYVYCCEIFPTCVRAKDVGFSIAGLFVMTTIYTSAAGTAFNNIGYRYYIVFIVITSAMLPLIIWKFPETKGLSLEEIGALFGDRVALDRSQLSEQERYKLDERLGRSINMENFDRKGALEEEGDNLGSQIEDIEQRASFKAWKAWKVTSLSLVSRNRRFEEMMMSQWNGNAARSTNILRSSTQVKQPQASNYFHRS